MDTILDITYNTVGLLYRGARKLHLVWACNALYRLALKIEEI